MIRVLWCRRNWLKIDCKNTIRIYLFFLLHWLDFIRYFMLQCLCLLCCNTSCLIDVICNCVRYMHIICSPAGCRPLKRRREYRCPLHKWLVCAHHYVQLNLMTTRRLRSYKSRRVVSFVASIALFCTAEMLMAFELFIGTAFKHFLSTSESGNWMTTGHSSKVSTFVGGGGCGCCWIMMMIQRRRRIILAGHSCKTNTVFMQLFAYILKLFVSGDEKRLIVMNWYDPCM